MELILLISIFSFCYSQYEPCADGLTRNKETHKCCDPDGRCCASQNCLSCWNENSNGCVLCESRFNLINGYCGIKKCKSHHCTLCNADGNECYQCSGIYYPNKGKEGCTAKDRIIAITVSLGVIIVAAAVIIFILCRPVNKDKMQNMPYYPDELPTYGRRAEVRVVEEKY